MSSKKIKQIYIYRDSHLPEKGWLQACFDCYIITSKLKLFDIYKLHNGFGTTISEFYIYMCPKCNREIHIDKKRYNIFFNNYKKYIYINYPQIYNLIISKKKNISATAIQKWWKQFQ